MVEYDQNGEQIPTPPGHADGASPSQYELATGKVSPASNPNDITSQRIKEGYYNPQVKNPYPVGSQDWYKTEILNRENDAKSNTILNPIRQYRPEPAGAPRDYFMRPGITPQSQLGDTRTQKLISEGYSPEQALTIQINESSSSSARRYYENERQKALENNVEFASGYHKWAKDTGIPQAVNPYAYVADLSLYALKGTQGKDAKFSPVNPSVLNLPGGKGVQDVAWERAVANDKNRVFVDNYNFNPVMDAIASAKANRVMGPYGNLNSYSSSSGNLSLAKQQEIGLQAAKTAGWETRPDLQGLNPAARDYQPFGNYKPISQDRLIGGKTVAGGGVTVNKVPTVGQPAPFKSSVSTTVIAPSGEIPFLGVVPFLSPMIAKFQPNIVQTTIKGQPYEESIKYGGDGEAAFTNSFVVGGKKSDTWTYAVGEPQPVSGGYIQNYETVTIPKTQTVVPYTTYSTPEIFKNIPLIDKPGIAPYSTNLAITGINFARTKDFGGLYKDTSYNIATQTTHGLIPSAKGFGNYVESKDTSGIPQFAGLAYLGEEVYTTIRDDPIQDITLVALPGVFKFGEVGIANTAARAATSGIPGIGLLGKAASTPAAITIGSGLKAGLVGAFVIGSGMNYMAAPNTAEGKGRALGSSVYQVGMMGIGSPLAGEYTPTMRPNPHYSKTLVGGVRKVPLSEKILIKSSDLVNGIRQSYGQRTAIKEITSDYTGTRKPWTTPENTITEPDISKLTHVKKSDIPAINKALSEQPSVLYGSGTMEAQIGTRPAAMRLREKALPSSDVDVFTENKIMMEKTAGKAAISMDIHTFPEGYPNVGQKVKSPTDAGSYLFGNRYRVNPFLDEITQKQQAPEFLFNENGVMTQNDLWDPKLYSGEKSFEHLNVQFRKLTSAVRDDVFDPLNKGYRLGKDISRYTRVGDTLEEVRTGKSEEGFGKLLKQTITYNEQTSKSGKPNVRTDTLFNIRERYELGKTKGIPEPKLQQYSTGVVGSPVFKSLGVIGSLGTYRGSSISSIFRSSTPSTSSRSSQSSSKKSSTVSSPSLSMGSVLSSLSPRSTSKSTSRTPSSSNISTITPSKYSSMDSLLKSLSKSNKSTSTKPSQYTIKSTSTKPSKTSTKSRIYKTNTKYLIPSLPDLPRNKKSIFGSGKSFFGFRETVPTWTPEQQASAIFGKYKIPKIKKRRK